jgi:hypothetical protein
MTVLVGPSWRSKQLRAPNISERGGGDHAVGVGLELGTGELIARQIERAPRAIEPALCFIGCRLLAVEVGDRGPAVGLELRMALEIGSRLREIRGRRGELCVGALQLQPLILGIEPATTSPIATRSPTLTMRVTILPATRKPRSVSS